MARFLFGPVTAAYAEQHLHSFRQRGECLAFGPGSGVDVVTQPTDSWKTIQERLPHGWVPDFLALFLASYLPLPIDLWSAPIPLVGLAGDWQLLWHTYRHQLPRCECILTDTVGVENLTRVGLTQARQAILYGCGRNWEAVPLDGERDIDLLFVGGFRGPVQRGRLPWLGRLAALADRWRVVLTTKVYGDDYRQLLGRARIAFNRSVRGECNQRTIEAIAAGALLFQEADNREVPTLLRDRQEYVAYRENDLEALLDHYLENDDERRQLAAAAQQRLPEFTFESLWGRQVEFIERELPELRDRVHRRPQFQAEEVLSQRLWQLLNYPRNSDPTLVTDFHEALGSQPRSASSANPLVVAWHNIKDPSPQTPGGETPLVLLRRAWQSDPTNPLIGLNLALACSAAGNSSEATAQVLRTLNLLENRLDQGGWMQDVPLFLEDFDYLRVEWERAAWEHAGNPEGERVAKRNLLCWRLHALAAKHTGQLAHFYEAYRSRPDLPPTQAALGHALIQAGLAREALPYLRQALASNPFDGEAARLLYHALGAAGAWPEQHRLARDRQRLHRVAPRVVFPEPWFPEGPSIPEPMATAVEPVQLVWEGGFHALHSLSLVNRALGDRLLALGQEMTLIATDRPPPLDGAEPLAANLAARCSAAPSSPAEIHVRHQWPPSWMPPPCGRWVVMQHWEYGSLPQVWVKPLAQEVDEVWVLSAFARRCFIESGVPADRVQVIPGGVDVAALTAPRPPFPLKTQKPFRFLFVGGTIPRKGIDLLLAAYAKAFRRQDDVCLVIKDMGTGSFYQGQTAGELVAQHQADPEAPQVEYLDGRLTAAEMASLYQSCHCLVHPYRGEGFGLPIAEAMACGLPVIVTGYGAALDFCKEDNAFLLPAREQRFAEQKIDGMPTVRHPWMAEPDADWLGYYLRYVVEHQDEARRKGQAAAAHIAAHFSWDLAADRVRQRLRFLRNQPIRREQRPVVQEQGPFPACGAAGLARVSLTMIVKNEEAHLATCLGSVADLVAEIVIVDTGSTDRTKEIAAGFGAKVIDFLWVDSFAAARNESLRHATGDWVLWLDGDEYLNEDNRNRLRALFGKLGKENLAYTLRQHSPLEDPGQAAVVDQVRLFPRHPDLRWRYRVHEQIMPNLRALGADMRPSDVVVSHTGFTVPAVQGPKVERNLRLLQLDLQEHPDDHFILYNLGTVALSQDKIAEALDWLRRSLERCHPQDTLVRKLYSLMARCHQELGHPNEALAVLRTGLAAFPQDGEMLFREAVVHHEQKNLPEAERCLEQLLQTPPRLCTNSADAGLYTYRAHNMLAEVLKLQGRNQEAETHWKASLASDPDLPRVWLKLARLYFEQGRWDELDQAAARLKDHPELAVEAELWRGRGLLDRKNFVAAREVLARVITARPQALMPRVLWSYTYLQEDKDLDAAEQALRNVLALDPNHQEARNNLAALKNHRRIKEAEKRPETAPGVLGQARPEVIHMVDLDSLGERPMVSITMIVKNEEANLPACLESLAGLEAELIIVDTGSTDRTREIAASFGAKVFDFPWVDNFAAARNEALRHACGHWIFWLDADDRLDQANREKLKQLFLGLKEENAAYVMKCLCLPNAEGEATQVDHLRLFSHHPKLRWTYRVHEQILPSLRRQGFDIRWSDVFIQHTGYQDPALRGRKLQRDLRLLRLDLAEHPDDPFILFNLGSVMQEQGKHEEALDLFHRSLARSAPTDSIVRKLFTLISQCQRRLDRHQEALATCREGKKQCPDDLELLFQEGVALMGLRDPAGAALLWEECLRLPPGQHFASYNPGLRGYITRHNLGMAYCKLGRLADAETQWRAVLAERPNYQPAWRELLNLLHTQKRWIEAKELAKAATAALGPLFGTCLRCRTHLARKHFAEARRRAVEAVTSWPQETEPRRLLSYALLQEGQDLVAAEQALCDVLGLDPGDEEARHNLSVLLHQQGIGTNGVVPPVLTLVDLYRMECHKGSEIQEQLATLYLLARSCPRVTVLGAVSRGVSTALLLAQPEKLTCYDRSRPPEVGLIAGLNGPTQFLFLEADVLAVEIEETDLLFVAAGQEEEHFQRALRSHASKVRKTIVLHAPAAVGGHPEPGDEKKMWQAVKALLAQGDFRLQPGNNKNGLAVLERG